MAEREEKMTIRRAGPADLAAVCALCRACTAHMDGNGIPQWDERYPSREIFERDIAQGGLFVAVEPGGGIAGCLVLNSYQDEEYRQITWEFGGRAAVVHRLMVLPAYEGRGVAGRLLGFAEELAARRGFQAVRLDMFSLNPRAIAFYRKHGYLRRGAVRFRKGLFYCAEKRLAPVGSGVPAGQKGF